MSSDSRQRSPAGHSESIGRRDDLAQGTGRHTTSIPSYEYDVWLFDLDGTIVDIHPDYIRTLFDRIGGRLGQSFTDSDAETLWYGIGNRRERRLSELGIDVDRFWRAFHEAEDPHDRATATYLYDDAEVLSTFDRPLGLVTHCQSYLTEPVLDALDIRDWFDTVVCCSDETGWKPDSRPVDLALSELGFGDRPRSGVLVGDDSYDTGAAWNAGLTSVHVERVDPRGRGRSVLADHCIRSFSDIA